MTLTKEWLLKTISELENERDATPGAVNEDAAMALAAMKLALASLTAEPEEREAFETFMADRFGDTIDRRRAKNGDQGYMAWDMIVAWTVWQCRAAMLQGAEGNSPAIPDGYALMPVEPTMAMLDEFDSIIDHGAEDSKDGWSRLLAAAPQQEVK